MVGIVDNCHVCVVCGKKQSSVFLELFKQAMQRHEQSESSARAVDAIFDATGEEE